MVESPEQQHPKKAFGWAAKDSSGVLSPFKFSRRETGKNDVMFKVLYCGICHTDLHMIKNEWGNSTYPLLPGHEIVGVVTEVGTKVEKFKVGDHVGVGYMAGSCQSCDSCSTNAENYCPKMIVTSGDKYHDGTPTYGGYSDIMVANEHFVVRIPDSLPLDGAAPLLCAGVKSIPSLTTFSSLQVKLAASQVKGEHVPSDIPRHQLTTLIRSIINKQDEPQPFYVLDLGVLVSLMQKWNRCLPNVLPFFAVKCNPEPALIAALATLGASFDCASKAEIEAILSHGVSPSRIVYANPCKSENHLRHAAEVGVNLATFDSIDELNKLKRCHPKCSLLLRIAVPNDTTSWRSLGTKFGALSEEVAPLLRHAHKLGLRVVGVSFHVGSKASESQVYRGAIAAARAAFDVADELKLPKMHVLDIGGGFKENPLFDEIAETLNDAIKEYFGDHQSESDLVVMAEPGRFFAETAFTLVANVMGKRVRGEKREYWITDGIYGSFNLPVFDKSCLTVSPLLLHTSDQHHHSVAIYSSTVFGPTCDSLDTVVADCKLPELKLNDYLVFHNMGAYTSSAGTNFNGFCISAIPTCLTFTNANN